MFKGNREATSESCGGETTPGRFSKTKFEKTLVKFKKVPRSGVLATGTVWNNVFFLVDSILFVCHAHPCSHDYAATGYTFLLKV